MRSATVRRSCSSMSVIRRRRRTSSVLPRASASASARWWSSIRCSIRWRLWVSKRRKYSACRSSAVAGAVGEEIDLPCGAWTDRERGVLGWDARTFRSNALVDLRSAPACITCGRWASVGAEFMSPLSGGSVVRRENDSAPIRPPINAPTLTFKKDGSIRTASKHKRSLTPAAYRANTRRSVAAAMLKRPPYRAIAVHAYLLENWPPIGRPGYYHRP